MAIKIHSFRSWIESRLTELLEGLEDEILWSLVFNYLEDAQKKAKREGPAANPSGSLSQSEVTTALTGFLGAKAATTFVNELFSLLQKAQENGGIPPEFAIRPEVAEKEAFSIINEKKREMDISDRVKREISRNDRYNERSRNEHYSERSRRDDRYYDSSRRDDRYYDSRRDNNYYDTRRDDYHNDSRYNDQYNDSRRDDRYNDSRRHSNRNYYEDRERSSAEYHKSDVRRESHRNHNGDSVDRYRSSRSPRSSSDHRSRSRNHRDSSYRSENDRKRRNVTDSENEGDVDEDRNNYRYRRRSPIKSSSPESAHETWESETTSKEALPRAPNVQETVSSELEQALRAKALLSMAKAKQ